MEQDIRFCTTEDGVRIAYSVMGSGPPLLRSLGWFTHLEHEDSPNWWQYFNRALSERNTLIRYDGRGMGLSDRNVDEISLDAKLLDLAAVVKATGFERYSIFGISEGGPTAVAYTVRNPDRVERLILYGTTPAFDGGMDTEKGREQFELMLSLVKQGWGSEHPSHRQFFTGMFLPDASGEAMRSFTEFQRASASAEQVLAMLRELVKFNVRDLAQQVNVPTLVIHRRGDTAVSFEGGREFASLIPGARFMPLEGRNHIPQPDEPEARQMVEAINRFLTGEAAPEPSPAQFSSSGLITILFTDMESSTELTQRLGDEKAQDLVRKHNDVVREALKAHRGTEVKHTGDGIMASFPTARGALAAAVEMQRQLTGGGGPRVRIGLNAGEPVAEERDLFGTSVQLAARVCNEAEAGQILVSNVVRELAAGKGFLFSDRGDVALRGFEDPVRLYEVSWQER